MLQQYGLNAGDMPDPESDTVLINPAYGYTVEKARISMNFFYGVDSISDLDDSGDYYPIGLKNTGFFDFTYLQPLSNIVGFYLNATPIMQDYEILYHPDYGYGALDIGGGVWLQVIPGLTIGISGKYYSGKLGNQPGLYTEDERTLDSFFLRAGFSIDLSPKWNISYALRYMPGDGANSLVSTLDYLKYDTYLYPFGYYYNPEFSHNFFIRGEFSNSALLSNHIDMRLDNIVQYLTASSILKFKINATTLMGGLRYNYYNSMAATSQDAYLAISHDINLISGAEFLIVPWLKLRLGVSLLSFMMNESDYPYQILSLFPQFQGGLNFRISPTMDFEINLSKTMFLPLESWQTMLFNFELSYDFK